MSEQMTVEFDKRWSMTQIGREMKCVGLKCGNKTLGRFLRPQGDRVPMCRNCAVLRLSREAIKQLTEPHP
jgi:hypothetical protein